jgi:hypothetical protein
MPRATSETKKIKNPCPGGRSFNRKGNEHERGKDVYCRRCKARMGCSWCCERPNELVCLNCHDWAHLAGLKQHGPIVKREKALAEVQKILDNPVF